MRYVKIPEPIQLKNLTTGEPLKVDGDDSPWQMYRYLVDLVLPDPAMGRGYKVDRIRSTVRGAFDGAEPGGYVAIEDEHYDTIRAVIENPESEIPPIVTMQLFAFQQAFVDASRENPKVLEEVTG